MTARRGTGPRPTTPGPARLDLLDGVRAVAALFVVLHHAWLVVFRSYPVNTGPVWLGWLVYGHLAVSVFIVVSGFSLSLAPARRAWTLSGGARTFLARRAWRIVPTYWAALVLSCIVFGVVTPAETGDMVSVKAFVVHAALLQDVVDSPKPNGAFWSIAVEWQIYFLFPAILLLHRRGGTVRTLGLVTAAVVVGYLLATRVEVFSKLLDITPQYVALFVMGVAAAGVLHGPRPWHRWLLPAAGLVAAGFVALCWVAGSRRVTEQYFWVDLLVGAGAAAALAGLAGGRGRSLTRVLASGPLVAVGAFAYSTYLVHAPVLWLVWHFGASGWDLEPAVHLMAFLALALPVVLVGSWVFHLLVERPFLERRSWAARRDWARRGRVRAAGAVAAAPAPAPSGPGPSPARGAAPGARRESAAP